MKLKILTKEETQQLIDDLNKYWTLCSTVTAHAFHRIEEGYNAHRATFKWKLTSPITFKVQSFESMVHKICGGQFRDVNSEFMKSKGFTQYLSCWDGDADPKYFFVQQSFHDIVQAANVAGSWEHRSIADFHELVETFAEHPLVPDEGDMKIIKMLRCRIKKLESFIQEYNDAI